MTLRNCFSALSIPAAVHLRAISPERQRLTFQALSREIEIIDSMGLVDLKVR